MTSIDKLLISNIRSFGPSTPESPNIIEFYKPLTIIVGHNGAGKTTIIECLKYVTTGDVPPNSDKGQAFVRDPKVAGVSEIKAQIKLRFRNLKGAPVVVTRSLQLTQKANSKLEYKTLEGVIQLIRDGQKVSQSHRCADIDAFIPTFMGASKAMLNNVIFCHQEESNWPLLERTKVKQKFDDIFCATRYNKALDEIKKLKKEHGQHAREAKFKLETIQTRRQHSLKLKAEVKDLDEKIEKATGKLASVKERRVKAETILKKNQAMEEAARKALMDSHALEREKKTLTTQRKSLEKRINVMEETMEELVRQQETFDQELESAQASVGELKRKKKAAEAANKKLSDDLTAATVALADGERDLAEMKASIGARDEAIIAFAEAHPCGDEFTSGPFSEEEAKSFLDAAKGQVKAAEASIKTHRKEARARAAAGQKRLGSLRSQVAGQETTLSSAGSRVSQMKEEIAQLEEKVEESRSLVAALEDLELSATSLEVEIEKLRAESSESQDVAQGGQEEALKQLGNRIAALEADVQEQQEQAVLLSKIKTTEEEASKKKASYQAKFDSCLEQVGPIIGTVSGPTNVQVKAQATLKQKQKELKSQTTKVSSLSRKEAQLSSTLAAGNKFLKAQQQEMAGYEAQLSGYDAPVAELLEKNTAKLDKIKGEISMANAATVIYNRFIEEAKEHSNCPLCLRGLADSPLEEFMAKLVGTVDNVPASLTRAESSLKRATAKAAELKKLEKVADKMTALKAKVAEKTKAVTALETKHSECKQELEKEKAVQESLQQATQTIMANMGLIDTLVRDYTDHQKLAGEATALRSQLPDSMSDADLPKAKKELEKMREERKAMTERVEAGRKARMKASKDLSAKLQELSVVKGKLLAASNSSSTIERHRAKMKELRDDIAKVEEEAEAAKEQLAEANAELAKLQKEAEESAGAEEEEEKKMQKEKDEMQGMYLKVEGLVKKVAAGGDEAATQLAVDRAKQTSKRKQKALDAGENTLKQLSDELASVEDRLRSQETIRRALADNIRLLELDEELARVSEKIEEAKRLETEGGAKSADDILKAKESAQKAFAKLQSVVDKLDAELGIYVSQTTTRKREMRTYADVDDQYKKMVIELNTVQLACDDLEKYHHVLDKALMDYHTMKIEEINKTLKELWQSTYKGQDIDSIEIRADHDGGSRGKPSYNYRVAMVKGDMELNMRGRCSAGQRVLASLVIRLALAEALGVNCGIIALDEPTTNLDRANVESFATALVNLIENRRRQTNFQLVVITHDEEFVQLLGRSKNADYYWRVAKDMNQQSTLKRCDISDLA